LKTRGSSNNIKAKAARFSQGLQVILVALQRAGESKQPVFQDLENRLRYSAAGCV